MRDLCWNRGRDTPCRPGLRAGGGGRRPLAAPWPAHRVPVPSGRRPAPSVRPQRPAVWPGNRGRGRAPCGRSWYPQLSQLGGGRGGVGGAGRQPRGPRAHSCRRLRSPFLPAEAFDSARGPFSLSAPAWGHTASPRSRVACRAESGACCGGRQGRGRSAGPAPRRSCLKKIKKEFAWTIVGRGYQGRRKPRHSQPLLSPGRRTDEADRAGEVGRAPSAGGCERTCGPRPSGREPGFGRPRWASSRAPATTPASRSPRFVGKIGHVKSRPRVASGWEPWTGGAKGPVSGTGGSVGTTSGKSAPRAWRGSRPGADLTARGSLHGLRQPAWTPRASQPRSQCPAAPTHLGDAPDARAASPGRQAPTPPPRQGRQDQHHHHRLPLVRVCFLLTQRPLLSPGDQLPAETLTLFPQANET